MKKFGIVLLMVSVMFSCMNNKNDGTSFNIKGTLNKDFAGYVFLQKIVDRQYQTIDSAEIKNNAFELSGAINSPEMVYLNLSGKDDSYSFFIENADLTAEINVDSIKNSKVAGSETQNVFELFNKNNKEFDKSLNDIYVAYKQAGKENQKLIDSLNNAYDSVENEQFAFIKTFIGEHSNSVVAPYLIRRHLIYTLNLEELEKLTSGLSLSLSESEYTKWLFKRIDVLRKVAIGQPATDFTLTDIDGNPFPLSQLKGSIVLVDFWASWCMPCRRENPNVVKIYKKYHSKGFDILGVSFDKDKDKWLKAINDDHLTWNHVSDLKGWNNAAGKIYGVMSIPHTVLINRDGIIVAKNLRGEELEKKVKELLK
ncbi:MAG: AhpC/TSA family protein [Chlorobi bacterium]|nr:AhpC/TSA family protein [Chlorobiota bacterium]